jgi:hypothetical protein
MTETIFYIIFKLFCFKESFLSFIPHHSQHRITDGRRGSRLCHSNGRFIATFDPSGPLISGAVMSCDQLLFVLRTAID